MKLSELYKPSLLLSLILIQVFSLRATEAHDHEEENKTSRIQVGIFSNSSFTMELKFPVTLGNKIDVYVEMRDLENSLVLLPKECHISAYRNTSHHEAQGYLLINNYCPAEATTDYVKANDRESRFKFAIRQYFGMPEQYLFLHCTLTTCQRAKPRLTVFNCATQAQYCPHPGETFIDVGPFVVLPVGFKHDRDSEITPMPKFEVATGKTEPKSAADESQNCLDYTMFTLSCIGCFLFGIIVTLVMFLLICKINASKGDQATGHANAGADLETKFHV